VGSSEMVAARPDGDRLLTRATNLGRTRSVAAALSRTALPALGVTAPLPRSRAKEEAPTPDTCA
jgi:hypothetical protein